MKNILLYLLYLLIINNSIQVVPLWNFESSSFNLFANGEYHKYNIIEKQLNEVTIRLERKIFKENGNINIINSLFLNNQYFGNPDYDDIESFYQNNISYLVCPKGKFHMYIYNKNTRQTRIAMPFYFENYGDWNLMCNYQWGPDSMFIAYLGGKYGFYQYNFQEETFTTKTMFDDGIYAFILKSEGWNNESYPNKQMYAITRYLDAYYLKNYFVDVTNTGSFKFTLHNQRKLSDIKSKCIASFGKDNNFNFYWINYNNVSDFEIGSHSDNGQITTDNFNNITIEISTNSPLLFFEKMTIIELEFIFTTCFAYYKLKDDKNKFYYGIIDASKNRVIFHTDEEITKCIPYSDYAMLAITNKSAYKICISRNETDCEICNDNQLMLDSSKYNFCGTNCNSNYILMPHNICTDTCDERIFSIKDNKCGLCKDFGDGSEFKFYNQTGCTNKKPENSIFVNEDLKIIDCDINYKYENGNCILKCHDYCEKCSMYSTDINNQQCTSCKNNLYLQKGNCVEKCSNKYFLIDKQCRKCDNSCESCDKASNNCTSCINGKYIDNSTQTYLCKNCSDNCETCENSGDNCLTCNQALSFKYFFNSSCYENCPNNTKLSEIKNICEEIRNENDNGKEKNNPNNNSSIGWGFLIIILILLFLFLLFFLFFRRYRVFHKKTSEGLLIDIDKELREN